MSIYKLRRSNCHSYDETVIVYKTLDYTNAHIIIYTDYAQSARRNFESPVCDVVKNVHVYII